MRWPGYLLLLLLLAGGRPAGSAAALTDDLDRLLEGVGQLRRETDFDARGRLVQVDGAGGQTSYDLRVKSKCFGESLLLYWEITGQTGLRWRLLAEAAPERPSTLWLAGPGTNAPELLPPVRQQEALAGTHLSLEDLLNQHLLWKAQALLGPDKIGARECFVVRSEPEDGDLSGYRSVTSWLETRSYLPLKVEKRLPGGRLKTMVSRGIRRRQGTWGASQLEVTVSWDASRTLVTMTGGSARAGLQAEEFSMIRLFAPE